MRRIIFMAVASISLGATGCGGNNASGCRGPFFEAFTPPVLDGGVQTCQVACLAVAEPGEGLIPDGGCNFEALPDGGQLLNCQVNLVCDPA